jgi:hypothetical protein
LHGGTISENCHKKEIEHSLPQLAVKNEKQPNHFDTKEDKSATMLVD